MEEWKQIILDKQSKYTYEVSNYGRVKRIWKGSVDKKGRVFPYREDFVAINSNKQNGYYNVCVAGKKHYLHRLVAQYFCEGYSEELEVNHKDGNKANNRASNLEWVNRKENMEHASKTNLINIHSEKRKEQCRENQKKAVEKSKKAVVQLTEDLTFVEKFDSISEATEQTKIKYISKGLNTGCLVGGYRWVLYTDYIKN